MHIIKLDAIPSTNDFLKQYAKSNEIENFTIVTATSQTNGKGQMGSVWQSESGKNLIMSIFVKDVVLSGNCIFKLNKIVALSVQEILCELNLKNISIKWPNDIMADRKKIGGILIENVFTSTNLIYSIIGIGLNVNQVNFEKLPKASSLRKSFGQFFDLDVLRDAISNRLQYNLTEIKDDVRTNLNYKKQLFKRDIPMAFEDKFGTRFMGIITDVSDLGMLVVQKEDDSFSEYGIKEIKMLY